MREKETKKASKILLMRTRPEDFLFLL